MARITHGVPKADKSLKGPEIDWTGHVIRDGRGYHGEGETDIPAPKQGAFPPKLADLSRLRTTPAQALAQQIAGGAALSAVSTQRIVDGAVVEEKNSPRKGNPGKTLQEFWAKLRSDPKAMEEFVAKKKAGFEAWRAKRKAK